MIPCYPVTPGLLGALRVGGPELAALVIVLVLAAFSVGVLVAKSER